MAATKPTPGRIKALAVWARVHLDMKPAEFYGYTPAELRAIHAEWVERERKLEFRLARLVHAVTRGPATTDGGKTIPFDEFFHDPKRKPRTRPRRVRKSDTYSQFLSVIKGREVIRN